MACGERGELDAPGEEERVWADEEGVGLLANESCNGRIDLSTGAGIVNLGLHPKSANGQFHSCERRRSCCCVGRIHEHGDPNGCRSVCPQNSDILGAMFML